MKPRSGRLLPPAFRWLALAMLVIGIALRGAAVGKEGLWLDEIFGASYTNLSLLDTLVAVARFDIHPPFYYLQLNAWSAVAHNDAWLMLNSVLWSSATLVAVLFITTARFGRLAGLCALACCAVMGSEIHAANELRMYAMLGFFTLLAWCAADRVLTDYRLRTPAAGAMMLLLAVIGGLHGASILPVSAVLLYVFPWGDRRRLQRLVPTWAAFAGVTALSLLPWLILGSLRTIEHTKGFSWGALLRTMGGWPLGQGGVELPETLVMTVGLLVAAVLLAAACTARNAARLVVCFVLWPLLFGALLSTLVRPIWLDRTFSFCAPFVAIGSGVLLARVIGWLRASAGLARTAGLLTIGVMLGATGTLACAQTVSPHKMQYRELAAYLRSHVEAGEAVYVPQNMTFWGVARYLVGPRWGSMLEVQDPIMPDHSEKWRSIYRRLGTARLQALDLLPKTRELDAGRFPMMIGWSPLPAALHGAGIWVVLADQDLVDPRGLGICPGSMVESVKFAGLSAFHIVCEAAAAPAAA